MKALVLLALLAAPASAQLERTSAGSSDGISASSAAATYVNKAGDTTTGAVTFTQAAVPQVIASNVTEGGAGFRWVPKGDAGRRIWEARTDSNVAGDWLLQVGTSLTGDPTHSVMYFSPTGTGRIYDELLLGAAATSGIGQIGAGTSLGGGARINMCANASSSCGGTGAFQYFTHGGGDADHIWYTDQGGGTVERMRLRGSVGLQVAPDQVYTSTLSTTDGSLNLYGNLVAKSSITTTGGSFASSLSVTGHLSVVGGLISPAANVPLRPASGNLILDGASGANVVLRYGGGSATNLTTTLNGGVKIAGYSKATLLGQTPASTGELAFCSDCSPLKLVISTGTSAGNWAAVDGGTFQ